MKRMFPILLCLIALTVTSQTVSAQITIDANAVYALPTGDFADTSSPGYGIAGEVFVGLPMLPLEVGGRAGYTYFGADDKFDDGHTSMVEISPSVRYIIGPPLSPLKFFGQLGIGAYSWSNEFKFKGIGTKAEDDATDFGFSVGLGIKGKLGPLTGITAMPMYHIIKTEDENTTFVSLNVGLVF